MTLEKQFEKVVTSLRGLSLRLRPLRRLLKTATASLDSFHEVLVHGDRRSNGISLIFTIGGSREPQNGNKVFHKNQGCQGRRRHQGHGGKACLRRHGRQEHGGKACEN